MRNVMAVLAFCYCTSLGADPSLEAALALLNPDRQPTQEDAVLAPWTAGGHDLWVVAALYEETLQAAVLREAAGAFTLVARSEGEEPLTIEPVWGHHLELDLIPFRISDAETAFGVRFANSYLSTERSSSTDALHLYRLHDGELTMVFAEFTSRSSSDRSGDTANESGEQVVIVTKNKHDGYYDLLVRDRKTKKTATWRWNGERYEELRTRGRR